MLEINKPLAKLVFYAIFGLLLAFTFFPIVWMVSTSFKPPAEIFRQFPSVLPEQPILANYTRAITEGGLARYLLNSLITAGGSAVVTTFVAAYAAFSFAKYRYRGRLPIMYLIISARMFPLAVILISFFPLLNRWGLTDTHLGLVMAYIIFALPAATYILYSYFMQLPTELIEAARVDGASEFRIIHGIIFPLSLPSLITVGLYGFMWGWNDLLFSLTLITTREMRTVGPGLLFTYLGEFRNDWGGAMAASIIVSVPIVIAFMLLQRFFIKGLTAGAVKS